MRNQKQTAYHILVADKIDSLDDNAGNIWDSGVVSSNQSINVKFDGKDLQAGKEYFWKVKVWDKNSTESNWSNTGKFVTSLFEQNNWDGAKWIAYEEMNDSLFLVPGVHPWQKDVSHLAKRRPVIPYFRKEFKANKEVKNILIIAADTREPEPGTFWEYGLSDGAAALLITEDDLLPLSKDVKIFVTGPTADMLSVMNGGWTITWQGNAEEHYPSDENTVLEALENRFGKNNITYSAGSTFDEILNLQEVLDLANKSDVVVACLGEPAYCEAFGSINDLTLDEAQLTLVEELSKTGKPIILVMLEGRPRIINRIADKCRAVIVGFLPGMKGGDAIADVIIGNVNPSGKLPITYPNIIPLNSDSRRRRRKSMIKTLAFQLVGRGKWTFLPEKRSENKKSDCNNNGYHKP